MWYDHDLKETVNKIPESAFDIMHQNAKNPAIFNNKCPLTYHGNSDRIKSEKKLLQTLHVRVLQVLSNILLMIHCLLYY